MGLENRPAEVTRFTVSPRQPNDPRSAGALADAHALGFTSVSRLVCHDLYFIEGDIEPSGLEQLARQVLSDPITQNVDWRKAQNPPAEPQHPDLENDQFIVEVSLRPGVTDPVASEIVRAAEELGIRGVRQASTGWSYIVCGPNLHEPDIHALARRLLANPTIHRYAVGWIDPIFPHLAEASGEVERIELRTLDDDGLTALSKERLLSLSLAEMQAIRAYFQLEERDPTDVEIETLAQTWSEHCVHKTFRAKVRVEDTGEEIDGLLKTFIRRASEQINAPWVRSAFVDNAGVIDFDSQYEVSFKVETHNHPSAIEPFGGANTGVGGVIRDILGVSADPIAATDVLCFGPQDTPVEDLPEGVLHPRRIQSGVVAGVQDYGNKIGIPTVNGAILYDPGYTANPLVFCGCVGIAPKGSHSRQPLPGDRVIVLGGRTGRDGLRGATFSSMTMDAQTGEVSGASVQIGDPITEKGLLDVIRQARSHKLYHAITDCGAGGLSSAVGEMGKETGVDVDLSRVRLKYPGLTPWEIWESEAQERQVLAVPPKSLGALLAICADYDVELTDIGVFTSSGRLVVRYKAEIVLDLDNHFLHEGIPQRYLTARLPVKPAIRSSLPPGNRASIRKHLFDLLSSPNIASKEAVIRIYDHEVQGGTVVKPLVGLCSDGPSDGCVLKPIGTSGKTGIALSNGINSEYGKLDAYRMAVSVVDEAVRNAVAVGANPARIALLDNFCWGDPLRPETLGSLVEAARGCHDAAVHHGTPFISGKDSLNNEYLGKDGQRHAIPPTLLISAIGLVEDVNRSVTMDLKSAGNLVYLVGEFDPVLGTAPGMSALAPTVYRCLYTAIRKGMIQSCHDLSEGGLAVAAAEMCFAGRLGMRLELIGAHPWLELFGETNGCLLVEVRPGDAAGFESRFACLPFRKVGEVRDDGIFSAARSEQDALLLASVADLAAAWKGAGV